MSATPSTRMLDRARRGMPRRTAPSSSARTSASCPPGFRDVMDDGRDPVLPRPALRARRAGFIAPGGLSARGARLPLHPRPAYLPGWWRGDDIGARAPSIGLIGAEAAAGQAAARDVERRSLLGDLSPPALDHPPTPTAERQRDVAAAASSSPCTATSRARPRASSLSGSRTCRASAHRSTCRAPSTSTRTGGARLCRSTLEDLPAEAPFWRDITAALRAERPAERLDDPCRATYRLQFRAAFRFADAAALAPYSPISASATSTPRRSSPPARAAPTATTSPTRTASTRSSAAEAEFRAMAAAFRAHGLGLILDIVPNHMGIGGADNRLLAERARMGRRRAPTRAGSTSTGIHLSRPRRQGAGALPRRPVRRGARRRRPRAALRPATRAASRSGRTTAHKLPSAPATTASILRAGRPGDTSRRLRRRCRARRRRPRWDELKSELLAARGRGGRRRALAAFAGEPGDLASWSRARRADRAPSTGGRPSSTSTATRSTTAASSRSAISPASGSSCRRSSTPPTRLVARPPRRGADRRRAHRPHRRPPRPEGLLRCACAQRAGRPFYLLVEKILAPDEALPADWQADGTTGYEFANLLVGLLVDPAGTEALIAHLRRLHRPHRAPGRGGAGRQARDHGPADGGRARGASSPASCDLAEPRPAHPRPRPHGALRPGSTQVVAALDVYRTYADARRACRPPDRARIEAAVADARRRSPALDPRRLRLHRRRPDPRSRRRAPGRRVATSSPSPMRLQQLSGPVMAKGLEDTALYRFNRLIALNEVGSEPGRFGIGLDAFHRANAARLTASPRALLATSTHDTKRGEDARARIAALSEPCRAPGARRSSEWHDLLADPDAADRPQRGVLLLPASPRRLACRVARRPPAAGRRPRRPRRRGCRRRC